MGEPLNLSFENLRYQVTKGVVASKRESRDILKGISGEFKANELSAVVGPSGSGKSTVLDVLSGYKHENVSGAIKINGREIPQIAVRRVSSYVLQDNALHKFLTVHETIMFAASFKSKHKKWIQHKVENILNCFGMMEHSSTMVKELSGGQRKRLSIAVELVDDPSVLFLDEPTTGLDSSSSTQCIQLLKKLAMEGKTVVCSIHSPSALIFEMFDHLYALADGHCIYQGTTGRLVPFLTELSLICPESHSPSDFLLEIATDDYGPLNYQLVEKIENGAINYGEQQTLKYRNQSSVDLGDLLSPSSSIYALPFCDQVQHLMYRSLLISSRDKTLIIMRLMIHVILSFSVGFIYRNCGEGASNFYDNYRFIVSAVVFQLYTSYFSLQTASKKILDKV
jgi:ABC-type multidrug transport system ATPase subunit